MNTVAIIQARMGSTRLPGKVLRRLCEVSVLGHVIRRVRACPLVDRIVVATTASAADDPVEQEALAWGCAVFRGSEEDVLSRYYLAAVQARADVVVRVTSDCPLLDPAILCQMLEQFLGGPGSAGPRFDYLSNTIGERTFPRGLDAEVFTFDALAKAHAAASDAWEREHVTPYIYNHAESFRLKAFRRETDLSQHRWTLDTEEDWTLIKAIYDGLGGDRAIFTTQEAVRYVEMRPELAALNSHVVQKQAHS